MIAVNKNSLNSRLINLIWLIFNLDQSGSKAVIVNRKTRRVSVEKNEVHTSE